MAALNFENAAHVFIHVPMYAAAAGALNAAGVPSLVNMEEETYAAGVTYDAAAAAAVTSVLAQVNTEEETQDTAAGAVNTNGVPVEDDGKLAWKMAALAQCTVAVAAVINRPREAVPADSGELAYLVGLGGVFVSGVVEILAALWDSRGAAGRWNLYASFGTLMLGLSLDVVAVMLKNNK